MKRVSYAALAILVAGFSPLVAAGAEPHFDWSRWRDLPAQNGGRQKPLDTLAWETLRVIGNRSNFADPDTGRRLCPTALYLSLIFEWQGWGHADRERLLLLTDWRPLYFHLHQADKWDRSPLLRVDYLEMRALLPMDLDQPYISPLDLSQAAVEDPRTGERLLFSGWAARLARLDSEGKSLSRLEKKGLELADRLSAYQELRMGRELHLLPVKGSETGAWTSLGDLFLTRFDDVNDPSGQYRRVQRLLREAQAAYQAQDADAFDGAADELKASLRKLGSELGTYPSAFRMGVEVGYNRWTPFRFAWVFMLCAAVFMLLHLGSGWKLCNVAALLAYGAGLAAMLAGFAMRISIAGRPPVTNMYESVVYVGLGVAVFGLVFELIYRAKYFLTAAATVSTVALVLADNCPAILDPSVRPLEPVLRSNFWLVIHVMTITLSYAAFALSLGIANITLGYFLVRSANQTAIAALTRFTYKAIQVGVLLLAAGIILGGVWADYSWGRFWGWDPKEVWALVALLSYLCVLHARYAGWVGQRGLAALAVACFTLVVMAWYGVNFVLGAGLHSYGFGAGGQGWVYAGIMLEWAYAGLASLRGRGRASCSPPPTVVIQQSISVSGTSRVASVSLSE